MTPPANDDFANRQYLPEATQVSTIGTTIGATREEFEKRLNDHHLPRGQRANQSNTVWYDWIAPYEGKARVSFERADGHTAYMLVFAGTHPSPVTLVYQGEPTQNAAGTPVDLFVEKRHEYTFFIGNTSFPGDFTFGLSLEPVLPVVTVSSNHVPASRASGHPARFLFQFSHPYRRDVTLNYDLGGTAVAGTDYQPLAGTLIVPTGATEAGVKVEPLAGNADGLSRRLTLKLRPGIAYNIGARRQAHVEIFDDE